ncbi:hypothetical protein IP92_05061 [Pseudoduganella flava]|uniref:Energy transducer TonB n=1 Tax=Pseudoduganella flava TaxID=871742 RepID=A0A562PHM2_9BURK|nr:hypothetical protein [Pseudoduganella flava]QGZ40308.1 hypothetical protein GO485_15450 [Pseudoduganella flava]TWI43496.1 hypothetical protein IP92_05061 [Pseudoduganella flava]
MQQNLTYPGGPRGRGLAVGLAVSLLLHIVLLAFLRAPSAPAPQRDERRWTQPLSVRLLPPPPPVPRVEPAPPPPRQEPRRERRAERPAESATRREQEERPTMSVVPPPPAAPAEPAPSPFDPPPKFDPDAAKATARAIAGNLDTPSSNWAAEKLNQGKGLKETKEERLGRNVANSARPDCRTAYAGAGLFAPLMMLMDKKDSGCKF